MMICHPYKIALSIFNLFFFFAPDASSQARDTVKRVMYQASDSPAWIGEGQSLLFTSPFSGSWQVYKRELATKKLTRLTFHDGNDESPVCSPDGQRFIFESERNGNADVWIMNIDGTKEERLTDNPQRDIHPTWHPNGKEILFNSAREDTSGFAIYKMDLETRKIVRLTDPKELNTFAQWSPDGSKILFVKWKDLNSRDICIMDKNGKLLINLTNHPEYLNGWPSWSPTGESVIFAAKVKDKFQIYSAGIDGSNLVHLIKSDCDDRRPYWSKDKKKIAFDRTINGVVTDLFIAYFK